MTYKPSQARYDLGGKVKYLVYESPQPLADGRTQQRTRVKRMYFPGDATKIEVGKVGWHRNRLGRRVFGVPVTYRYVIAAATAHRGRRLVPMPARLSHRTKLVTLPMRARGLRLTSHPPRGPLLAVA
jgi:hypothetical protein